MPSPSRAMHSVTEVVKAIVGGGEADADRRHPSSETVIIANERQTRAPRIITDNSQGLSHRALAADTPHLIPPITIAQATLGRSGAGIS
ncbi:hypothetical protein NDA11_007695 [Ustilago hordei]|uniref:Uncharacterized protein n=1 Tax=Ustilago hordei TaxID=120017 RepID=I2FXM5_USTHO|nr:uncharacterized protein UHO2_00116 [Ustilago hordei]KAJ1043559.1 hypothetical protein NDA10_000313 [Ustilago hordei]KAJ1571088.1 hypothetical protein NDA11_007695 [Ustilago hordei]KAJ1587579.1 hypothetical protein NDA15_006786 [Ustilago hordei]KAJ1590453.1 hypothetical protein NDA12_007455 [Ustilago hordei]KAJ1602343.1 hypothetical protein NDA14_004355 [Ustilago hordei]